MPKVSQTKPKISSQEGRLVLKSCPRCQGARRVERDPYGWYVMCFTCGYTTYPSASSGPVSADRKSA